MEIVESEEELYRYLKLAVSISKEHPVLIDRYLNGKELEVDAVSDGTNVIIPGILEHIERAGVHSGDSIAVYPAPSISAKEAETVAYYTTSICRALGIRGVVNIQYVIYKGQVYVLEVNPRGSRTLPLLSKVTGVPLVELAVRAMLGESLRDNPYGLGLLPNKPYFAVKAPVFSFAKLKNVEVLLGPEMRSTGEVLGVGLDLKTAVCKALLGAGLALKKERKVLATQNGEILPLLEKLKEMGAEYEICTDYEKNREKLARGQYGLVVACDKSRSDFLLRRQAVEYGIPAVSSPDTLRLIVENMDADLTGEKPLELSECLEKPMLGSLKGRDFLSLKDYSKEEIYGLLKFAAELRKDNKKYLKGKVLGMIFAKNSTRTRISFEVGMLELGGHAIFLSDRDIQLARGETIADTARVLSRYLDGIMIRTFSQGDVEELAKWATIPVINGLTDYDHPCQALADLLTIKDSFGTLSGKLAYIGDGNNMATALIFACAKVGMEIAVASPEGFQPDNEIVEYAKKIGGKVLVTADPAEAARGANVLYTDVWTSMGQEEEMEKEEKPLQVTK